MSSEYEPTHPPRGGDGDGSCGGEEDGDGGGKGVGDGGGEGVGELGGNSTAQSQTEAGHPFAVVWVQGIYTAC